MPTLQAGQTVSIQLAEGEVVSAVPTGAAQASTRGISGAPLQDPSTFYSARSFGPYAESGVLNLACLSRPLVYTQSGVDGARLVLPASGDTTGVADRVAIKNALSALSLASGKGTLVLTGAFWVSSEDAATTNTDPGIDVPGNVEIVGTGNRATSITVVGGSKCNIFRLFNVSSVAIRNLTLDGNRSDAAMPLTGGSADAWRNAIRIASTCDNITIENCTLRGGAYHGCMGVGAITNFRFINNDCTANGFRGLHLHQESGIPGEAVITGNRFWSNGASELPGFSFSGSISGGALSVVNLTSAAATTLGRYVTEGITSIVVAVPNASTSGSMHFSLATLSGGNPSGLSLTIATAAVQASGAVTVKVLGELTSGLFVTFGCERQIIANNIIRNEPGHGIQVTADSTTGVDKDIIYSENIVSSCGIGVVLGSESSTSYIENIRFSGIVVDSVYEGIKVANVRKLMMNAQVSRSGAAGVRVKSFDGMQNLRIDGLITDSGGPGVFIDGSGEIKFIHINASLERNGANVGLYTLTTTIYGSYSLGFGQGVLSSPGAINKHRAIMVTSPAAIENNGGAVHLQSPDWVHISIPRCVDNVETGSSKNRIAIRVSAALGGRIKACDIINSARTSGDYAISTTGTSVDVITEECTTNYNRAGALGNVIYVQGTGCEARDNKLPASCTVQYASGGAAASDAARQRVA